MTEIKNPKPMIFKLPWPILELTELESKLKLRLTILYHNFLGVSQSANKFTVSPLLGGLIFYRYYRRYHRFGQNLHTLRYRQIGIE